MCGRYTSTTPRYKLAKLFEALVTTVRSAPTTVCLRNVRLIPENNVRQANCAHASRWHLQPESVDRGLQDAYG